MNVAADIRAQSDPAAGPAAPEPLSWIRRFGDCTGADRQRLGGKGANLARLHGVGLPVPDGFCVEAGALVAVAAHNQLDLDGALASADASRWSAMAERLRSAELPGPAMSRIALAYEALGAGLVAVRSSACEEDGDQHSFAGQHSSFLMVQGLPQLLDRLRDCWASLFSPAAMAYRQRHRGASSGARMAVVVQRMIPASLHSLAGVAFARDPLQPQQPRILIEACVGLGEGLVGGRVAADGYTLSVPGLEPVDQRLAAGAAALLWCTESGRPVLRALEPAHTGTPLLDTAGQREVARLLMRCCEVLGGPQDIEWVRDDRGRLWLLQSRPITALPEPSAPIEDEGPHQGNPDPALASRILWSRMDIGEIFTGRMTPLGISFARHYQYHVHRECGRGIGLLDLGDPDEYMGYHRGHVYLNVAYTAYLLSQTPAGKDQQPFLHRFSSEDVDLGDYRNPYGLRHGGTALQRLGAQAYWCFKSLAELLLARRRARAMVASRHREYDRAATIDLGRLDRVGLRDELRHALAYFRAMHIGYLPFYINAFGLYGLLEALCAAWLPGRGLHLQNRLKGDMSNLRTVQSARDLWSLTQALCRYPGLQAMAESTPASRLFDALAADRQGQAFLAREYAAFMRQNGVRAHEEMELTHPRWVDDPGYVFQMLKTYLRQGFCVDERLASNEARRGLDSAALLADLPPLRRWVLRQVIRLYCGCSRLREETRMSMITSIWLVRRIVAEVARRLCAQGLLREAGEMAWLDFGQLQRWLEGEIGQDEAFDRRQIEQRRDRQQAWIAEGEPALTFIGRPPARKPQTVAGAQGGPDHLSGLGTSHGRVRGQARVILDLRAQAQDLRAGEIIVAPFTDASWTPLFALAGAVVTDIGSMLSHSSIVAREFGIPSVVNTQTATSLIRSGDWISVDGERGLVHLERRGDGAVGA